MRCAVMTAQLLGLHRPGHYRFKVIPRVESGNLPILIPDMASKIIEHNQMHSPQEALDMTQEIDQELLRAIAICGSRSRLGGGLLGNSTSLGPCILLLFGEPAPSAIYAKPKACLAEGVLENRLRKRQP